ncbi:hypothetical protein [Paraclostridium bifermentans]|uniref:hypothetical protein n=1 Tax=Paraclostridium bifermentans TaxID=1490 RepID=UPI0025B1B0D1|nr:hypothetical protein [Paraclostridium bifermentans]
MKFNLSKDTEDLVVAMEELSELQKEISKALRDKSDINHITEEIADVEVVIEKLKKQFNISNYNIEKWKRFKKERTKNIYNKGMV